MQHGRGAARAPGRDRARRRVLHRRAGSAARRRDRRAGTPACSRPRSTTGCTSRTGRRRSSTRSAPSCPAGAVGATLSGSGPTVIVWADDAGACAAELARALPGRGRARAPRLARRARTDDPWELELGEPFDAPYSKLVAPARLPDGTEVVAQGAAPGRLRERARGRGAPVLGRTRRRAPARPRPRRAGAADRALRAGNAARNELRRRGARGRGEADASGCGGRRPAEVAWRRLDDVAERWLGELPATLRAHGRPFERRLLDDGARRDADARADAGGRRPLPPGSARREHPPGRARAVARDRLEADRRRAGVRHGRARPRRQRRRVAELRRRLDLLSELLGLDRERMRRLGDREAPRLGTRLPDEAQLCLRGRLSRDDRGRGRSARAARRAVEARPVEGHRPPERPHAAVRRALAVPLPRDLGRRRDLRRQPARRPGGVRPRSSTSGRCSCPTGPATGSPTRSGTCSRTRTSRCCSSSPA